LKTSKDTRYEWPNLLTVFPDIHNICTYIVGASLYANVLNMKVVGFL